jgi:IclR family KDG regulon transcriptional repressor
LTQTVHRPTSRVLDILELLSSSTEGYTLTEIADAIGTPKSSIFPVIHTMNQRKFISISKQTLKYEIGINTFAVGSSYLQNLDFLSFIKEEMKNIVDKSLETCQLGVLDKGDVLYIAKIDSLEPIRLISSVGKRLPAYCTALGKALICDYSSSELRALYPSGLNPYTKNTITDLDVLHNQLIAIRENSISMEFEESTEHIKCVAVPVCKDNRIVLAISVTIPTFRETPEKIELIKKLLIQAKNKIEILFSNLNTDTNDFTFLT